MESDDDDILVLDREDMPSELDASDTGAAGILAKTSCKREVKQLKVVEGQVIRGYLYCPEEDFEFQRELHQ
ncbi:hypothetical protein BGZ73_008806 [Actinomortierella ambigua]|nr:hypothetical protein BGZ73_008806 [Actinomortierella ambigua]